MLFDIWSMVLTYHSVSIEGILVYYQVLWFLGKSTCCFFGLFSSTFSKGN